MSEVFISYSSEDREDARRLAEELEASGLSVWWDRHIPPGRTYDEVIEEALGRARCVVVLWSESSVASDWVKTEAAVGYQRKALVPALLERVEIPLEFRRVQAADLIAWRGGQRMPGAENVIRSVRRILQTSAADGDAVAPIAGMPRTGGAGSGRSSSPTNADLSRVRRTARPGSSRNLKFALAGVAVVAVVVGIILMSSGEGEISPDTTSPPMTREEASAALGSIVADIAHREDFVESPIPVPIPDQRLPLPPIDDYMLVVDPPFMANATTVEVWVSTEKSGEGTDGWFVDVAEAFNAGGIQTADGAPAQVAVRRIPSGTAYQFIAQEQSAPHAYSPSNHLWVEMAKARGVPVEAVSEQLVANTAGLVLRSEKAEELTALYGPLDSSRLIEAVKDGNLTMAYTDPFASSTGLNFLVTVLLELAGGDESRMLAPDVADAFEAFQSRVPFVALTTLQIRDSVVQGGTLEAFVMEYQTFVAEDALATGFEFVPFGVTHDNPLYAVGDLTSEELEVLDLFADFASAAEYGRMAEDYGFDPPPYRAAFDVPSGSTMIQAQALWKERKDGGRPIAAVFVTDVSGSMAGQRIGAVREALSNSMGFISERNSIGMVVFSDEVEHVLPIRRADDLQKGLLARAIRDMDTIGGTAMYDGIMVGLSLLLEEQVENPEAKIVLIVLTDGETQDGHTFDDVSDVVRGLRVPIYTVGFEADLEELARLSGLVEAGSINADLGNVESKIAALFNGQL